MEWISSGYKSDVLRGVLAAGHSCIECVCLLLNSVTCCINITLASLLCIGRKAPHQAATMDEMDLPQMKKEVESLKYQLAFKREKSSKTVTE